jgi:hypothetical protein
MSVELPRVLPQDHTTPELAVVLINQFLVGELSSARADMQVWMRVRVCDRRDWALCTCLC